jgi:hypothetical protein
MGCRRLSFSLTIRRRHRAAFYEPASICAAVIVFLEVLDFFRVGMGSL